MQCNVQKMHDLKKYDISIPLNVKLEQIPDQSFPWQEIPTWTIPSFSLIAVKFPNIYGFFPRQMLPLTSKN